MTPDTQTSFTTARLLLEPLTKSDDAFIFELVNTEGWIKYIGNRNVTSLAEAAAYIQKILDNPNVTYWTVKFKDNATRIGIITFIKRSHLQHHDLGFAFLPAFSNQGYAFEAAGTVLNSIAGNFTHSRVLATTLKTNFSSIRLLKKLGFYFEKEIEENTEKLHVYTFSADKVQIDAITRSFFSLFANTNNTGPNLQVLHTICIPEVLIITKKGTGHTVYNLASFIEPRQRILTDGTLTEFQEQETLEQTKIINNIAQRYCEYQKSGVLEGTPFKQKGYKLLQFVKTTEGWKISSVVWEDVNN